jgi:hypothetical protein
MSSERKASLIKRWAHAPWHAWLKDEPEWLDLLAEVFARIPEDAMRQLTNPLRPLVLLPPVQMGRVVRLKGHFLLGASILQLDEKLLKRPRNETLGIIAHELAHLCVPAENTADHNDTAADALARAWGFSAELYAALAEDLEEAHPRVQEARKTLAA